MCYICFKVVNICVSILLHDFVDKDLIKLVQSCLSKNIPPFKLKGLFHQFLHPLWVLPLLWRLWRLLTEFLNFFLQVDISKQSTRASYPADFNNYRRNSYFEISDNHPCFSCGVTKGDTFLVLVNSSENLYHVFASTNVLYYFSYTVDFHTFIIVVTLQKIRHILVIDLKLLDVGSSAIV